MKFLGLHIKRYGHFTDVPFAFDGDGVQLVLGPNEAGKTTLLEFVRELLFGFAERNPYDFGNGRIEGSATLRLASGQVVEVCRHKGRKNTVAVKIEGRDTAYDSDAFNRLLGGATANLFHSVFAFGLKELAAADNSLGHESVRSALYSGGLANVVNPKQLLDSLKKEAEDLFKKSGQIPVINALCSELSNLTKQVKEKSVRSETYLKCRDEFKQAQEQAQKLGDELNRVQQEHSLTRKLAAALPLWLELNSLRRERDGLTVPDGFPTDGKQQFETAQREIDRLIRDQGTLAGEIEQDQQDLDEVAFDPRLVQQKATVAHVQQMIKSVTDARRDLPLRQTEMESTLLQVRTDLAELVPEWSLPDLQAFRIDAATRDALTRFVKERQQLAESETELLTRRKGLQENLRDVAVDLSALGEPADVSALTALLEEQADYTSNLKEVARARSEQGKVFRSLTALLPRLNPPFTAARPDAHFLPVPQRETVAQFKREFAEQQQRLHTAQQSLAEEEANLSSLKKQLASLHSSGAAVPTREGLAHVRGHRDAGWALIRRKYVAGDDVGVVLDTWLDGDPRSLPDVYEEVVRDSDRHADALFDKSSAVAKQEQIEAARRVEESKQQAVETQRVAAAALRKRWQELWHPCGFEPLEPDAMESSLEHHRTLGQLVKQRDEFAVEFQTLSESIGAYEAQLRTALGDLHSDGPTILAMARTRVDAARNKEQDRQTLNKTQRRLMEQEKTLGDDERKHQESEQTWQTRWQTFLGKLRLPLDWAPELAQSIIARLATARVNLEKVPGFENRIASMKQRLGEFDPIVRDLCEAVAHDLLNKPPEVAAATLQERLTPAVAAQERRATLDKNLTDKRKKLPDLERRLSDAKDHRQNLLNRANAASDDEFRQVADRAARISTVDTAIVAKQRELELIRENEGPEGFVARLQKADLELLTERLRDLDSSLEEMRKRKTAADEQVGSCRTSLAEFEKGSGEAAALQELVAAKRAQLAVSVDRYVPLVFAREILQKAIERFEHESQPEMLREVTHIFQLMTAGRYVRVERPMDNESPLVVYRQDDEPLEPSQLSTGTREQLYLAIRLAYVLHYCNRAEPLPIVMDDVLANFDDDRVRQTFQALGEVARRVQVIIFTCHPHLVELARGVFTGLRPVAIGCANGREKPCNLLS